MIKHRVRLYPDGEYGEIEADSAKEAAERKYGGELFEAGQNHQARVLVRTTIGGREHQKIFYSNE